MKKAVEADDLDVGDGVVRAHHPVAAGEPVVENTEQPP
jgi:hypothetical protein